MGAAAGRGALRWQGRNNNIISKRTWWNGWVQSKTDLLGSSLKRLLVLFLEVIWVMCVYQVSYYSYSDIQRLWPRNQLYLFGLKFAESTPMLVILIWIQWRKSLVLHNLLLLRRVDRGPVVLSCTSSAGAIPAPTRLEKGHSERWRLEPRRVGKTHTTLVFGLFVGRSAKYMVKYMTPNPSKSIKSIKSMY